MKLTTMLRSALALGLGFAVGIASAGDTPLYGATFADAISVEAPLNDYAYADGVAISNNYCDALAGKGWFVESLENDTSLVTNQVLKLNTESGTLTNKLDAAVAADINTGIAGDGAYFEFEAKFVASDTPDAGIAGGTDATKLAVYAFNSGEEGEQTKLAIFHAYFDEDYNLFYTNDLTDITVDTEAFTKVRIDMFQVEDGGLYLNAFKVTVGEGASAQVAKSLTAYNANGATPGDIFLTAEDYGDDANKVVSALNFKGTGEVDNIVAGTTTGTPVPPPAAATAILISADGTTTNEYAELASAFAAAQEGDTVKLLEDLTIEDPVTVTDFKGTLDLGGFSVGTTFTDDAYITFDGACDVVITNGTMATGEEIDVCGTSIVTIAPNTTLNNAGRYGVYIYGTATLNIYGTINNTTGEMPCVWMGGTSTVNAYEGCVVSSTSGDAFRINGSGRTLNLYGGTFHGGYPVAYVYNENTSAINVYGGTFDSGNGFVGGGAKETVVVTPLTDACTAKFSQLASTGWFLGLANYCATGYEPVLGQDGYYTIQSVASDASVILISGTTETGYADLASAFAAAQDGDTVKLLENIGLTNELDIVDFNGTLDLNGFELSNDETWVAASYDWLIDLYVSDASKTSSLTITNGTVTLKDGHMFYVCAGATLTVAAETTINEIATSGCANPFRTYGKVGGHTGESSAIPCTVNVYGTMTRTDEASGGNESGVIDQCLGASVVNVYDGAVLTHNPGRLFKMSGGTNPTVNVYGGTLTAVGSSWQMFHAYAAENTVHIEGGQFTMANLFSSSGTGKKFNVSGLGADCSAMFSTTNSQIETLAYFCDEGYEPVLEDDWYVIKKAAGAPLAILIASGADPVEYTDLHQALVDGSVAGSVVELIADVDLTGINWVPVTDFLGKFDGKGHKISNLSIDVEGGNVGLFGDYAWGKNHAGICNLVISNATVTATGSYAGVLAAKNGTDGGGAISNVTVCGTVNVTGSSYVGGLVGHNQYNDIIDCHVIGDGVATSVIGSDATGQVGGIVGMSSEGNQQVWGCSVENLSVKGTGLVGGLWGRMHYGNHLVGSTVSNVEVYCAADVETAEVKIGTLVGGFVGGSFASVLNCTASNVNLFTLDGTPVASRWTGTVADGKNVALGTDVAGDAFAFNFSKPKLTAGTFEVKNADALTAITGWCAEGYAPVKQGDVYVIMVPPPPTVMLISGTTETGYATIAEAFAAAQDGDTVKLLTNVVADATATNTKDVTLDLDGFTVMAAAGFSGYLYDNEAGTLTIVNGTNTAAKILVANAGKVALGDGAVLEPSSWDGVCPGGTANLVVGTNAAVNASGAISFCIHGSAVVDVYGEVSNRGSETCCMYMDSADATINVYDGAAVTDPNGDAIRPDKGTLNIYGGAITGHGYPTIYAWETNPVVWINIYGGTISNDSVKASVGVGTGVACTFGESCKAKFSGIDGMWAMVPLSTRLEPGYEFVLGDDGFYTVEKVAPTVAKIGTTTYATLNDAFEAAKGLGAVEIDVLCDCEIASSLNITNTIAVLDLNGFTVTAGQTGTYSVDIFAGSDIVFTNGTINTMGKCVRVNYEAKMTIAANFRLEGTATNMLRVWGGVLDVYGTVYGTNGEGDAIQLIDAPATINVYDGALISSTGDAIRCGPLHEGNSTVNIYGGTLESRSGYQCIRLAGNKTIGTIYGGEFKVSNSGQGTLAANDANCAFTPLTDACKAKFFTDKFGWAGKDGTLAELCASGYEPVLEDGWYVIKAVASAHDIDLGDGLYIDGIAGTGDVPHTIQFTSIDLAAATVGIQAGEIKTAEGGSACTLQAVEALGVAGSEAISLAAMVEADADDATKGTITITGDISGYDTLFFVGIGPAATSAD